MEPFVLRKKDRTTKLELNRNSPYSIVTRAEQVRELMGQDIIRLSVESSAPIEFSLGDYIEIFGQEYTLNRLPSVVKSSSKYYEYEAVLEGLQYELLRAQYLNADVSGFNTTGDFSLTGDCELFATVVVANANRVFGPGAWVVGDTPNTDALTLNFSETNTLAALQQICKEFEQEFEITLSEGIRTLHIRQAVRILPDAFRYGQEGGLYQMSRKTVEDKNIVTRLYAYGASKNLRADYRNYSPRLRVNNNGYIESTTGIAAFGVIEGTKIWEDIYPRRTGTVSALGADVLTFLDNSMDFDLNEADQNGTLYLLPGTAAKVHFNTGALAGYEFEVATYAHDTKSFALKAFTDERGMAFPSPDISAFQIAQGDKYVLLDIALPGSYITTAEGQLNGRAEAFLDQNSAPSVSYTVQVDEQYLKRTNQPGSIANVFELGDLVTIEDQELNISGSIKLISYVRDVLCPYRYQLTIADSYQVSLIVSILAEQIEQQKLVKINQLNNPAKARRSYKTTQELLGLVFDTDGYFDTSKIKAASIETSMLAVGAKSQQLLLQNLVLQPNFNGQKNVIRSSGGSLIHLSIEEQIKTWNIQSGTVTLGNDNPYYIYAKCGRNSTSGVIQFSQIQRRYDEDPSDWYFLIGVLHSVSTSDGVRQISLTYGSTTINGRWIKTGVISSADGETRFDLDSGEIVGKIKFMAADGAYKDLADLELPDFDVEAINSQLTEFSETLGLLGANNATNTNAISTLFSTINTQGNAISTLQGLVDGQLVFHRGEGVPTLSNLPASDWTDTPTRDDHVNDLYYDLLTLRAFRFVENSGVYSWVEVEDERLTQALAVAAQALDMADGKRRVFVVTPTVPYDVGDLWTDGQNLRRCQTAKTAAQTYNVLDWVAATYYDNTVTTINGGIVTSGIVQLAGSGGSILAGITGQGTADSSVRFWAGSSYENRAFAPFRVTQAGEVFGRKRIEMLDQNNVGQAGISGANTAGDGLVRLWAGSNYAGRNTAPWRVEADGKMTATTGQIGDWTISGSGIINTNGNAYIIARKTGTNGKFTEARIGANVFPATFGGKGAGYFEATEESVVDRNFAIVASAAGGIENYNFDGIQGVTRMTEALVNGRRSISDDLTNGTAIVYDPSNYDVIRIFPSGNGPRFIKINPSPAITIRDGKEITIINTNDTKNDFYLFETVRAVQSFQVNGGEVVTLVFFTPHWYVKSKYDNNY